MTDWISDTSSGSGFLFILLFVFGVILAFVFDRHKNKVARYIPITYIVLVIIFAVLITSPHILTGDMDWYGLFCWTIPIGLWIGGSLLFDLYKKHKEQKKDVEALGMALDNLRNRLKEAVDFEEITGDYSDEDWAKFMERGSAEYDAKLTLVKDDEGNMRVGIRGGYEHLDSDDIELIRIVKHLEERKEEEIEDLKKEIKEYEDIIDSYRKEQNTYINDDGEEEVIDD